MSFVFATPDALLNAASKLSALGSQLNAANTAAATPTTGELAAGGDQVSAAVAAVFAGHGLDYQAFGAQIASLNDQFLQALMATYGAYAGAEATNAAPL